MDWNKLSKRDRVHIEFLNSTPPSDGVLVRTLLKISYDLMDDILLSDILDDDIKFSHFRYDDECRFIFTLEEEVYILSSRCYKMRAQSMINTEYGREMSNWELLNILLHVDPSHITDDRVIYYISNYNYFSDYM